MISSRIKPIKSLVSDVSVVPHSSGNGFVSNPRAGVYLGVKTCGVFLCFVAIVKVRVYYVDFRFVFFCFESLVRVIGSYSEDEPRADLLQKKAEI